MARSSYIYIVRANDAILAAFTVKHEMQTWMTRNKPVGAHVLRVRDNDPTVEGVFVDWTRK